MAVALPSIRFFSHQNPWQESINTNGIAGTMYREIASLKGNVHLRATAGRRQCAIFLLSITAGESLYTHTKAGSALSLFTEADSSEPHAHVLPNLRQRDGQSILRQFHISVIFVDQDFGDMAESTRCSEGDLFP